MNATEFKELVDDYLYDRLSPGKKQQFEEHYFTCRRCFKYLQERQELILTVKAHGEQIFEEQERPEVSPSFWNRISTFLSPKQWGAATAASAVIIFIALVLIPSIHNPSPEFVLEQDTVRGDSICEVVSTMTCTIIKSAVPPK